MKNFKAKLSLIWSWIKRELTPSITLIAALLLCWVLVFGLIWSIGKPFYDSIKGKKNAWQAVLNFIKYWVNVIIQILKVVSFLLLRIRNTLGLILIRGQLWSGIKYLQYSLALVIDLYGNVLAGELIEDIITAEECTLFGNGDYTISAATGHLEYNLLLNDAGRWFTNALSAVFEKNHSLNAYYDTWGQCIKSTLT